MELSARQPEKAAKSYPILYHAKGYHIFSTVQAAGNQTSEFKKYKCRIYLFGHSSFFTHTFEANEVGKPFLINHHKTECFKVSLTRTLAAIAKYFLTEKGIICLFIGKHKRPLGKPERFLAQRHPKNKLETLHSASRPIDKCPVCAVGDDTTAGDTTFSESLQGYPQRAITQPLTFCPKICPPTKNPHIRFDDIVEIFNKIGLYLTGLLQDTSMRNAVFPMVMQTYIIKGDGYGSRDATSKQPDVMDPCSREYRYRVLANLDLFQDGRRLRQRYRSDDTGRD